MKSARKKTKKANTSSIKISKKGVIKIVSVLLIAAIFAWFFVITRFLPDQSPETSSFAAPPNKDLSSAIALEAEDFSTYSLSGGLSYFDDAEASGGRGMMFSINTTADGNVALANQTSKIIVTAKSTRCHGGPTMVVRVDDNEVMNKKVPTASWSNYSTNFNLSPGSHKVSITFLNDFASTSGQGCDRVLFVDKISFQ